MANVRERTIFSDRGLTITAIEEVDVRSGLSRRSCFFTASVKPVAIVVKGPEGTYALDMTGQPVDRERIELAAGA